MLLPSIFGEDVFDTWMKPLDEEFFGRRNPFYGKSGKSMMKTDIKEKGSSYELDVDLPGFKKEDIEIRLNSGFLTINATQKFDKEEKDEKNNFIRKERYAGSCSRSFYVGEEISEGDIKAKLEDGLLKVEFPKKETKKIAEEKRIMIE
ncbi:MAG: Hsp20/alpha crystallin family protein [Lachnospiraceae bacterium]|nr:Hsp20/alpha crystallin family protein [Lachnospiraceae bacterium]